jgi:hypothetical protein
LALTLVALPLHALSSVGHAGGPPAESCTGAKLKASGKAAGARVACHAKAAEKEIAADPACLAKADTKLAAAFARAEAEGGCATIGDVGEIDVTLDSSVGAFVAALRPVMTANRCAAAKLKATGKKAKTKLSCHAKATGRGLAVEPACLARAETRFEAAFAKAEARPPCLTTGDAAAVESLVDDLVADAVAGILCGNGVREGSEECDGTEFFEPEVPGGFTPCPGAALPRCLSDCRCCARSVCAVPGFEIQCCPGYYCPPLPPPGPMQFSFCVPIPTTTTTTTLPTACGDSAFPTCGGTCPAGFACEGVSYRENIDQLPSCGGVGCGNGPTQTCTCVAAGSVCGGSCTSSFCSFEIDFAPGECGARQHCAMDVDYFCLKGGLNCPSGCTDD